MSYREGNLAGPFRAGAGSGRTAEDPVIPGTALYDPISGAPLAPISSVRSAAAITPDDDEDLATPTVSVYVGGTGDVTAILVGDTVPVTFVGVPAGTFMPIQASRILDTGTDATDLVGLS